MGDVASVVYTPFVAVGTTLTGTANQKVYYDCPRCGKEVWVYAAGAAFSGRKCIDCRGKSGPVDLGIVGDAIDVAITPVTAVGATITGNANGKIWYNCPKCGERKWVSACAPHLKGKICLDCKPLGYRAVESLHPMGQFASINKIKKDIAKFSGAVIYQQWGQDSDKGYTYKIDLDDKIVWYETHYCRILHGSASWLFNTVVQSVSLGQSDYIDHWWMVIKTKKGYYYQLQFRGLLKLLEAKILSNDNGLIELRKCSSKYQCNQTGLAEAGKGPDADIFDKKSCSCTYSYHYTIGDVVNWMKKHKFSAKYQLLTHNCQDLCKQFHKEF